MTDEMKNQRSVMRACFAAILVLGLLTLAGCSSNRNAAVFHPWGWEDAKDAKAHLDNFRNVLVVRVEDVHWEDLGRHRLTPYHFKGTVTKSYKGEWKVLEKIQWVHYVDAPAPSSATATLASGGLVFIFTDLHTNSEIVLDTGEWGGYREELAPALERIFPDKK